MHIHFEFPELRGMDDFLKFMKFSGLEKTISASFFREIFPLTTTWVPNDLSICSLQASFSE